ncbi:MAG: transcriptional repressor, partial [Pseudomonadota bacterium]
MPTRGEQMQADVLAILERAPAPLSAYDILGELRKEHPKLAPPTIYRALSALPQRDRVHRLESRNAFVACQHSHHDTGTVLSVCDDCGAVEENAAPDVLED